VDYRADAAVKIHKALDLSELKIQAGGRTVFSRGLAYSLLMSAAVGHAQSQIAIDAPAPVAVPQIENVVAEPITEAALPKTLPAGTPVIVALDAELSTQASLLGDSFSVTVVDDVLHGGVIVIPKGTRGRGEVTFVTKKGAFGKPGIIGIALREMELNGRQVLLDGRFREEGGNNNAATAATMFAVGIVAGLVKGKTGVIPAGRELKGRTGEDIAAVAAVLETRPQETPQAEFLAGPPALAADQQIEQTEPPEH
jgi:hypothetical protein